MEAARLECLGEGLGPALLENNVHFHATSQSL